MKYNKKRAKKEGTQVLVSDFDNSCGTIVTMNKNGVSVIQLDDRRRIICSRLYTEQFVQVV